MSNVNLWFARNNKNEIETIHSSTKENNYTCPICGSEVKPKALTSKKVSPHFAHVDVSKCNSESMIHWWFKHKFIAEGDSFSITTDKKINYVCKSIEVEKEFPLESGIYRPDLIVHTECGETVVFEMANTNKKMVKDYIDRWIELDKVVVEVNIKDLNSIDEGKNFKALYYKGKCFNFNKRDGGYYNTIGKLKEGMKSNGKYDIEMVKKLDWLWEELLNYKVNKDINNFLVILPEITTDVMIFNIFDEMLTKHRLQNLYVEFREKYAILIKDKLKYLETKFNNIEISIMIPYINLDFLCKISYKDNNTISSFKNDQIRFKLKTPIDDIEKSINDAISNRNCKIEMVKFDNRLGEIIKSTIKTINDELELKRVLEIGYRKNENNYTFYLNSGYRSIDVSISEIIISNNELMEMIDNCSLSDFLYHKIIRTVKNIKLDNLLTIDFFEDACLEYIEFFDVYSCYDFCLLEENGDYKITFYMYDKSHEIKVDSDKIILGDFIVNVNDFKSSEDVIKHLMYMFESHNSEFPCSDCDNHFEMSAGELKFYDAKGFSLPKRCKSCRDKRKKGASSI